MDAEARERWRARLKATYPWICPWCKTAHANQERFEQMEGVTIYRHPECGHVLCWRGGGSDWLEPYLVDQRQEGLRPMARIKPRSKDKPPYVPDAPTVKRTQRQP